MGLVLNFFEIYGDWFGDYFRVGYIDLKWGFGCGFCYILGFLSIIMRGGRRKFGRVGE